MPGSSTVLYLLGVEVAPQAEAQWAAWHRQVHMHDVLRCPGFRQGVRWRDAEAAPDGWARYLVLYQLESRTALDAYLGGPEVARLRADHEARFGAVTRLTRRVLADPQVP
jgi:Domain of unknown function (DUF4286)